VNHGDYRHNAPIAALNPWNMQGPTSRHLRRSIAACVVMICVLIPACESPKNSSRTPVQAASPNSQLAAARIDLAKSRPADEALALLVSALEADPKSEEARLMAGEILAKTRWHFPEITIDHRVPIDRIDFAAPSSLWVSLGGEANTTLRWNLESLKIENVLFPIKSPGTRSLVMDPPRHSMVVERAGIALLCNAQTLKPVRDIGLLPDFVTPSSVVVFSPDGLLLAHPAYVSETDRSVIWRLRDTSSGETLRKSEPFGPQHARPLAAILDRQMLRVLHADGSQFEMPVNPVEDVRTTPAAEPISLIGAQFAENGGSALILKSPGPHLAPELCMMSFSEDEDASLEAASLLGRFPWNKHPGIWTGLLATPELARLKVEGNTASILTEQHAPLHAGSAITALSVSGELVITGEENGTLTIHRTIPLPLAKPDAPEPGAVDAKSLAVLKNLTEALAGIRYDEPKRAFPQSDPERRLLAFKECDFDAILRVFPALDFSPVVTAVQSLKPRSAEKDALLPLQERIVRAFASPENPEIEKAFEDADDQAVLAAIESAGAKGPAAAKALELALASTRPEWIDACISHATGLPPLLRKLAVSRIAWLLDHKADAIAGWPDVFPELTQVRLREDWDGWEQADFSSALEKLRLCVGEELAAITVPENPTPEQRKAVVDRLTDPATVKAVGKARYASACLKAALALSAFKDENEATLKLANIARNLGQPAAPCLRAEAMSLTALGDYQKAHERWIALVTEHPVETQLPGDYAEAAYTAFENADPRQAMAILTTGLHRFPNDANFALRAGWVALLTGNAERAYRFLLTGRQIGYPEEKLENATALLAIAAAQSGAAEDATAFYQDLIDLSGDWNNPETIESLEWPEELKASLRQLVW
jgi:hypothetical protein